MEKLRTVLAVTSLSLSAGFAQATSTLPEPDTGGYEPDGDRGWFFYKEPPPEPEKPEPEEFEPVPVITEIKPPAPAEPVPSQPSGPAQFGTLWLNENLPKYRAAAIDNPTDENVKAYLYLQRLAVERAEVFARRSQLVTIGNPDLDAAAEAPYSSFAIEANKQRGERLTNDLLARLSEATGLFLFLDDSQYSAVMVGIMNEVSKRHGFATVTSASPEIFPQIAEKVSFGVSRPDTGQSELLGIQSYPAVVLMYPNGSPDIIAQGPVALGDLKERILISALRNQLISPAEYEQSRGKPENQPFPAIQLAEGDSDLPIPVVDVLNNFSN